MLQRIRELLRLILRTFNIEITRARKKPTVSFEIDEDFKKLYLTALKKTQALYSDNFPKRQRNFILTQLLRQVPNFNDNVNIAECGCWRGGSAYQIAYCLKERSFKNKFFIFDSFEGLSDFKEEDLQNHFFVDHEKKRKQFARSLDVVRDNLSEFDFIEYKKGWIPCRFNEVNDLKFSFVHIDVDLYQPIKDSLEFFYPRMVSGGIIVLDDYAYLIFPGAKIAADDFLKNKRDFFLHLPFGGAFIVKR